jgi:hypothetical protein
MKNQSLTITGVIVMIIAVIFEKSGVEIGSAEIQTCIEVLIAGAGIITTWYGRWRSGDITWLGSKISE